MHLLNCLGHGVATDAHVAPGRAQGRGAPTQSHAGQVHEGHTHLLRGRLVDHIHDQSDHLPGQKGTITISFIHTPGIWKKINSKN